MKQRNLIILATALLVAMFFAGGLSKQTEKEIKVSSPQERAVPAYRMGEM